MNAAEPTDPGSQLCLACGMCCDGTLFKSGPLTPDDLESAAATQFVVLQPSPGGADQRNKFPQPCGWFRDGCCSHYDGWRPEVCGAYACDLLLGLGDGRRTLGEALALVDEVRTLAADAQERNGDVRPMAERQLAQAAFHRTRERLFVSGSSGGLKGSP